MSEEVKARGRKPIELDKTEFQAVVTAVEQGSTPPRTRSELWQAVASTDWAKGRSPRPLTAQVAMMKADEMGLVIVTPKGKRGRTKGEKPLNGGRKKKVFSTTLMQAAIPSEERIKLEKAIAKAGNGSLKACIKLKCLDCTNWEKKEVALCQATECPLWNVRPYKRLTRAEETLEKRLSLTVLS